MTCAKRRVICILYDDASPPHVAVGENLCANPQKVCPREDGEGYEKCTTVCEQDHHAEVAALHEWERRYDDYFSPTRALIHGHERCCYGCATALRLWGVHKVAFGEPII